MSSAQATPPVVSATRASKWYGDVIAVSDLTLSIPPGVTGLLGPNGAGKSTLLKMIVGQIRPSQGEVRVFGRPTFGDPEALTPIGYCPEHDGTYDELTALELTTSLTELQGFARDEASRRAKEALCALDLGQALDRPLAGFSKGMRQRAKLAQALAHDPRLLILDEPLTGCDPLSRVKVLEVVRARIARGTSVILSSHVLAEIEALTANIVLIHHGQVVAEGDVHAVRALIDRHPLKVRVECDRPRELAQRLVILPHVVGARFEDEAVVIETKEPDRLYSEIPKAANAAGLTISALTSPDDNLQAVFRYLTAPRSAS
jgi:ABC-2 type transport system ATP-binding protein